MDNVNKQVVEFFKSIGFTLIEIKSSVFRTEESTWVFQTDHKDHSVDASTILYEDGEKIYQGRNQAYTRLVEVTTEPVVISEDDKPDTPVEDTVEEEQLPAVESGRDVQASEDNGVRGVSTDGSAGPEDPVSTRDVLPGREVLPLKDSGLGQRDDDATGLPRESGSDRKRQAPGTPGRVEDSAT